MNYPNCNRTLLCWTLVQLAVSFGLIIPFALSIPAWGGFLGFGALLFVVSAKFDQKVPRVLEKILWVVAALARWALVAWVVYALFFFAPDATVGYDAESRAAILSAAMVPLLCLCGVTLPSQAAVAARSKADSRRAVLTSLFQLLCVAVLYGYGVLAKNAVVFVAGGALKIVLSLVALAVAVAVSAVAFRGLLLQKEQQKSASDKPSKAE